MRPSERIMYIERKGNDGLVGAARIGRAQFSRSGKKAMGSNLVIWRITREDNQDTHHLVMEDNQDTHHLVITLSSANDQLKMDTRTPIT